MDFSSRLYKFLDIAAQYYSRLQIKRLGAKVPESMQKLARITKRPDYLAVASTRRKWVTPSFILQAKPDEGDSPPRAGFTASKKVGKAVIRSKARRRIKEAVRLILPNAGEAGWSYVFIARQAATVYPFEKLKSDIKWALAKLASGADLKSSASKNRR